MSKGGMTSFKQIASLGSEGETLFLKRLEITGFKSFAGKSVLDFEKGEAVAIVGPNGSGKSNTADAIRWVLGEQSYKTVRAKKSEDVIFSGSNGKAKASFARVGMTLDNSSGKAPIDFTEVEITRAVYRDGSSEYLINGKRARLLDVAELLAKSGFGQSTYSVIGQGMVDSMLFYGPAERKVLFDEAAGVRQYEIKREQTIKKLEDTSGNMIRIKDILSELNPRANTLKRQAEKAKEKNTVKTDLLEKQKIYFSSIWDRLTNSEKITRADLEKIVAEETKLQTEIAELNGTFNKILTSERSKGDETQNLQQQISELERAKDQFRQKIFTLRAKMEFAASSLTKKEITGKIAAAEKELAGLGLDAKNTQKEKLEQALEKADAESLNAEVKALENEKDSIRQEIFTLRAKMEVHLTGQTKEEISAKVAEVQKELDSLHEREFIDGKAAAEKEIKTLEEQIEKIEREVQAKRENISQLSNELSKFDFGTVGEKVSAILYLQNDFVIKVESAKDLKDVTAAVEVGKKVSERLKELRKQVGDVKEGRISGISDIQAELEKLLSAKEKLSGEIAESKSKAMRFEYEIKQVDGKRFELEKELGRLNSLKPAAATDKAGTEKEIKALEEKISNIEENVTVLKSKEDETSKLRNELLNVEFEIKHLNAQKAEIEVEIERLNGLKPAGKGEKEGFETEIEAHQAEIDKLEAQIEEIRKEINQKSNDFEAQGRQLAEIKDGLAAKQRLLSEYTAEVANLRVELAKFDTKKQDLREEIVRELGSEAVLADAKITPELDEVLARTEIEKLKSKLYAIGEIDPEVETEFKEVNSRVEFLSGQIEDLDKAKGDLEKMVNELDNRIKKQFESSFKAISDKFTHFFTLLFDGGEAKLELMRQKDEEDETERFGIEITAVPPGKKVKSISALSGGERTMTSLALLFAILSVNPAPFCVLDEVDAALDETNTRKFLKIVKELAHSTQFIFITHNRETMKTAGLIYGITMDESHASKMLSIKLSDALDETAKPKKVAVPA
jgi:chromosome segregation protein